MNILIPLPARDFDPTEVAVPFKILKQHKITFATPKGEKGIADMKMIEGDGLGLFGMFLVADKNGKQAYKELTESSEFNNPISYDNINIESFDALLLPGGHAQGMKEFLESSVLQDCVAHFFDNNKPVAAICHGVLLVARSKSLKTNKSVLHTRKTTALLKSSENLAYLLTKKRLGTYYKTYPETTVEEEVIENLESESDFIQGPMVLLRDSLKKLSRGFCVRDGNYLSARWPGDAHKFATEFNGMLNEIKKLI
ncbi:hypothetical protein A9Q84_00910 [Halobacteriovorax marinus]|uniref:DJ-1/PfpI domain-containing protein n=1 Tax=Halobacteriovorax marinus TaxID=97084 RepID=A0A1Y5FBM2_9BACT|nr:hypothetical protein A9Q84_00910 [Halobacteriovorax marinus]